MVRIAAVADLHCQEGSVNMFKPFVKRIDQFADILAIPGDLTASGRIEEIKVLIGELSPVTIPIVAVLGNHDYQSNKEDEIIDILKDSGVHVLDGDTYLFSLRGKKVGFTGCKGMLGGFDDTALPNFGERILKELFDNIRLEAEKVERGLSSLKADFKVVLIHYSPIRETLEGENRELYNYLGSSLPCMWMDAVGADLILHGHSHYGREIGETPGGISVRNVALPVINKNYCVYELGEAKSEDNGFPA